MLARSIEFFASKPLFITTQLERNTATLNKIFTHPFNQQLFDGTLSAQVFGKYLCDDAYYLNKYALVLKALSIKMGENSLTQQLMQLASEIIDGEQDMQKQYSEYFALTPDAKPSEIILSYIEFLEVQVKEASIPVALCSILPCFWIYYKLGATPISPEQLALNPYQEWIKTYSWDGFIKATTGLVDEINRLAETADQETQKLMAQTLTQSINHELLFFDSVDPTMECTIPASMSFK